ncbi:hypothetical protein F4779DRAFT_634889 [Xylariaceae sp. FL0662B]|nr:hypothetical protein F4779DRAFT_634889 [Xylariaceae sp. FL0662B]
MNAKGVISKGPIKNSGESIEPTATQQQSLLPTGQIQNGLAEPKSKHLKYALPEVSLVDRYADEPRKLRVAVIGARISSIIAGVLLPAKVPGIELTIFEKKMQMFSELTQPHMCMYQTSFEPNTQWSEEFAQGPEILDYRTGIARKYEVDKYLKLHQKVETLAWSDKNSVWQVKIRDVRTGELYIHEAEFVLTAIGRFNAWKLPDYPGIKDFKGLIRHTSNWDPTFDLSGKRVAVIGNGASGIQLVPNIQKKVAHLDHYVQNKTWIAESWGGDSTIVEPIVISKETRDSKDVNVYLKFRKGVEQNSWRGFDGWLKDSASNRAAREEITRHMTERLFNKPEFIKDVILDFAPHCRRLTPGPGYIEAITAPNVDYIHTPIKRFIETGIETVDCKQLPPFSIIANGKDLTQLWSEDGEYGFPYSYLGFATPGFPNLLFIQGPKGAGRSGTVSYNVEVQLTHFAKILRKVSREGVKTIQPSRKAADDFVQYSDAFWKRTVLSECSSWYNGENPGSRIHGLWPGSASLVSLMANDPRWEDWEYEYLSDTGNSLLWYFGNGSTRMETDPAHDIAS